MLAWLFKAFDYVAVIVTAPHSTALDYAWELEQELIQRISLRMAKKSFTKEEVRQLFVDICREMTKELE